VFRLLLEESEGISVVSEIRIVRHGRGEEKKDYEPSFFILKEGWVLLGVYPLTTLGDMTASDAVSGYLFKAKRSNSDFCSR
jgi:hypothetical protein